MGIAYLDTQIAVRLYYGHARKISKEATRYINKSELLISPMVYVELDYLLRIRRTKHSAPEIFAQLSSTLGVHLCQLPFPMVATHAVELAWTTDPFDKIIVAQAQANHNAPLITSDTNIAEHYRQAVW
jgi:PIN domain nuclease of toxin-antitoxin system